MKADLKQAHATIARLRAASETDFLLGVFNRRGFEREMTRAIAFIKRYGGNAALVVLDIDRLKPINDNFGHAAGDKVLKAVAALLTANVRASDTVARLGGDEFALLLWNLDADNARAKAEAIERAVDGLSFSFKAKQASVGASAGVAMLTSDDDTAMALARADETMYARKKLRKIARKAASRVTR